jgi:hypothetical protein
VRWDFSLTFLGCEISKLGFAMQNQKCGSKSNSTVRSIRKCCMNGKKAVRASILLLHICSVRIISKPGMVRHRLSSVPEMGPIYINRQGPDRRITSPLNPACNLMPKPVSHNLKCGRNEAVPHSTVMTFKDLDGCWRRRLERRRIVLEGQ